MQVVLHDYMYLFDDMEITPEPNEHRRSQDFRCVVALRGVVNARGGKKKKKKCQYEPSSASHMCYIKYTNWYKLPFLKFSPLPNF